MTPAETAARRWLASFARRASQAPDRTPAERELYTRLADEVERPGLVRAGVLREAAKDVRERETWLREFAGQAARAGLRDLELTSLNAANEAAMQAKQFDTMAADAAKER